MRHPNNIIQFKNEKIIHLDPVLYLNDSYLMKDCAIRDIGIVNLHDYIVDDALKCGQLVEILEDFQVTQQNIYLYYRQSKFLQPKIRRFIDYFLK
jgi:DNA-binding transcriptional LysR family regulator